MLQERSTSQASLQTFAADRGRVAMVFAASIAWVAGLAAVLMMMPLDAPRPLKIGILAALVVGYVAIAMIGMRRWAGAHVRYELNEAGISVFLARGGELRERLPWSDVREYVIETLTPASSVRALFITRASGGRMRVVERPEQRRAFEAFCRAFLDAAAARSAEPHAAPIRAGVSFYDKPVARGLGAAMLVLLVIMGGFAIFFPATFAAANGGRPFGSAGIGLVLLPFIYRTVFHRKR